MGEIKLKSGQGRQGFGGRVQLERRSGTKGLTGLEERRKWSLEGIIIETVHCLQYYIRQTDISRPLHRADDSCAHVEVRCCMHEPPDCLLSPDFFSSSGVRASQLVWLHVVCEFSALWPSATLPTRPKHSQQHTCESRPDHNGVQSNHPTPNFSA